MIERLGQRVLIDGEAGDGGAAVGGVAELVGLQRIDGEDIAMRLAGRRAGAAIGFVADSRLRDDARRRADSCPRRRPLRRFSPRASAGMSTTSQCQKPAPPVGASGSCMSTAKLLVPAGGSLHCSSGETLSPVQPKES